MGMQRLNFSTKESYLIYSSFIRYNAIANVKWQLFQLFCGGQLSRTWSKHGAKQSFLVVERLQRELWNYSWERWGIQTGEAPVPFCNNCYSVYSFSGLAQGYFRTTCYRNASVLFQIKEFDMKTWLIITDVFTTWAVVKLKHGFESLGCLCFSRFNFTTAYIVFISKI